MTTPQVPLFIPSQVCETVGKDPATTAPDVCMGLVQADLRDDGTSAPDVPANAGLPAVVADAKQKGIDLKIVVLDQNPGIDTPLRDVATEVGREFPGSTVLVLSPSFAGTYSPTFDRVTLEAGQDIAKVSGSPVVASQNFVTELTTPHFPWTPFTIVLVLGVAVAAVATRLLQVRGRKAATGKSPAGADS
ncbi:hypothetical protein CIW49_07075 [Mycolicibacterium sp. P1-18]|uniref:Rv1476 family membrane protein n=1 Tax=Mycolicibacterium sp. P1-18 TaxID=2024615 RepID=UPI0011F34D5A|nr:DUF6676 family protein [Mycolicibacterium sp. P1-18]KAA0101238.1 hypothetical protein CIW49_07075 [Mycolicibacterium sp. P1-18]